MKGHIASQFRDPIDFQLEVGNLSSIPAPPAQLILEPWPIQKKRHRSDRHGSGGKRGKQRSRQEGQIVWTKSQHLVAGLRSQVCCTVHPCLSVLTQRTVRRESNNASPALTPTHSATSTPALSSPPQSHDRTTSDPPEVDLRSLLAQAAAEQQNPNNAEDPMIKMLESFMGPMSQMGGDPNDPDASTPFKLDPDAIAKATGIPPFVLNQFLGGKAAAQTPEQAKQALRWKIVHVIFSLLIGFYALLSISKAIDLFGSDIKYLPDQSVPAPATVRNPWWIFLGGEVMLQSARRMGGETVAGGYGSFKGILQVLKDISRDGLVVVFILGMASLFGLLQV